jgi:DNA-binding transcriptional LysR family regulator
MLPDLNEALIFAKVAEQGSFIAAARALALPKTTVSRKVQELERRLGVRLLNRTTRKLSLTEAGATYFEYSSRIAQDLADAESAVQQLEGSPRGWLRVTAPYMFCPDMLSGMIRDFRTLYPEVRVEFILSNDRLDLIADGIDIAIRTGSLPDSTLVARSLSKCGSFVYASNSYIERYGEPKTPADLQFHHVLAKPSERRSNRHIWQLRNGQRIEDAIVHPVAIANDFFALRELLTSGQGLMLIDELSVQGEVQRGLLRRILPEWVGPDNELSVVFPGGGTVSPKVRAFLDFLIERFRHKSMLCAESRALEQNQAAAALATV